MFEGYSIKGDIVNPYIPLTTTKSQIHCYPRLNMSGIDLKNSRTKSLFQLKGSVKWARTGKIELPAGAVK